MVVKSPSEGESSIARRRAEAAQNQDYQRKRRELTRIAAELFHAQGLGQTSLADVAREAGLDRASVYYYFANKEELYAEVLRESTEEVCEEAEHIANKKSDPTDRMRELIEAQMLAFDRHYPYLFAYARDDLQKLPISAALKTELVAVGNRVVSAWEKVLSDGLARGQFESDLPTSILAFTMVGTVAWAYRWYEPGRSLGPKAIGRGLAAFMLEGIRRRTSDEQ
jgi:AcrR family transcriptional regulator